PPPPTPSAINSKALALTKENRDFMLALHRQMQLIRRFEERAQEQYTKAKIGGYCHLNIGEEATVVGGVLALKKNDYIFTSYREHGHAIARGIDPKAVMAELFGKETGTSHGRGGSMHMFDANLRFMGGYGIVGGHLPLAVGGGWAVKYHKQEDVVFCMFGDGATNIGAFHESLNMAKVFHLPVVWFCINNRYGMGTPVEAASAVADIYKKACAYDMESIQIDGMDLREVMLRTSEIVEKTRHDSEPRFIEALCYRFKGHSVVDPDKYRSAEDKEKFRKADPIVAFEHELEKSGLADEEYFKNLRQEIDAEVREIIQYADEGPDPKAEEVIVGTAIGSAMLGLSPVVEMMTINFSLVAYDQIVNNAAKIRYMFGGEAKVPMVIRMPGGAGHQLSAQHSHSLEVLYGLIPGLLVVAPTTPEDAKGMLKSAIRADNPVMFLESMSLYNVRGMVP